MMAHSDGDSSLVVVVDVVLEVLEIALVESSTILGGVQNASKSCKQI